MATLLDLVKELREIGVDLHEVEIPFRWYRQLLDYAEQLAETEEEKEEEDIY